MKLTNPEKRLLIELSTISGFKSCKKEYVPVKVKRLAEYGYIALYLGRMNLTELGQEMAEELKWEMAQR